MKNNMTIIIFLFTMMMAQDCCESQVIAEDECGGIGCYIPQCTDECEWELMQCLSLIHI